MFRIVEKAYAKINIYLEVFNRLDNGYHNIDTVMQTVSLCDLVTVEFDPNGSEINITCTDPTIPTDGSNIVYKCARGYLDYCHITGGVNIHIEKNIPSSAGLGGGSADGAAVLRGLNKICSTSVTSEELCKIGVMIGADIPFCIVGGAVRCQGVGDVFIPSASLSSDLFVVIAKGKQGSDTAQAYKSLDGIENRRVKEWPRELERALLKNDINGIVPNLYNAFECVVLPKNRDASAIKRSLSVLGADGCLMSGSGSAVFGIFQHESKAEAAIKHLREKGYFAHLSHPIESSFDV